MCFVNISVDDIGRKSGTRHLTWRKGEVEESQLGGEDICYVVLILFVCVLSMKGWMAVKRRVELEYDL